MFVQLLRLKRLEMMSSWQLAALFSLAYCIFLLTFASITDVALTGSFSYLRAAEHFLETGSFESSYRPPLYPLYLAFCIYVFGEAWQVGVLGGQVLFATVTCFITLTLSAFCFESVNQTIVNQTTPNQKNSKQTAERGASHKAVCFAALLWFLNLPLHIECLKLRETGLFIFLQMIAIGALVMWRHRALSVVVVAAAAALTHLTRPSGIVPFVTLGALLFVSRNSEISLLPSKRQVLEFVVALGLLVLMVLPWQRFVNRSSGQVGVASSSLLGANLWKGNNPYLWSYYPAIEMDAIQGVMRADAGYEADVAPEVFEPDSFFLKEAKAYIASDIVGFVARTVLKAGLYFSPIPIPFATGESARVGDQVKITKLKTMNPVLISAYTLSSLVLFLGVYLFFWSRGFALSYGAKSLTLVFLAYLALSVGLHSLLFFEYRFRFPLEPLLVVLASLGYSSLQTERLFRYFSQSRSNTRSSEL